jgi:hypothetical protein
LARLVFQSVEIADDRVTAITPQADFAPFFVLALEAENVEAAPDVAETASMAVAANERQTSVLTGGSDGGRFRGCILPPGAVVFASIPARRRAGPSRRDAYQQPRERRLSAEQEPNSGGWLPDGPCAPSLPSLA